MSESGEDSSRDGFMDNSGFLFDLRYVCLAMGLVVLLHDKRFLKHLQILWIILHLCQLAIIIVICNDEQVLTNYNNILSNLQQIILLSWAIFVKLDL